MVDKEFDKRINEADTVIGNLIREERIAKLSEQEKRKFVDFFGFCIIFVDNLFVIESYSRIRLKYLGALYNFIS